MLAQVDARKFRALVETNALLNSSRQSPHAVLESVLSAALKVCGGEAARILLADETGGLRVEAALGDDGGGGERVKAGESAAGWAARHNKPLLLNDAGNDPRFAEEANGSAAVKTVLAVPVRAGDECAGAIEVAGKKEGAAFTDEDLKWLELFAVQAGIALSREENGGNEAPPPRGKAGTAAPAAGFHTLIAQSPVIREKLDIIDRVAKTSSSVLILGESGVGKEVFAEQVHLRSERRGKPFVRVNCAALTEGLLESELFGHVRGAFTSASAPRQGRFELADGGTLFLDEIGGLPLSLQAKLLRALQEKTFEKVGSDTTVTVDVRVIAATNRDIEKLVERGEFRGDLYYRLNVFPVHIPPLRQRPEDIPALADFFLKKCAKETKKMFEGFSPEAVEVMLSYSWPGNVRELENAVERACAMGRGGRIEAEDLALKPSGVQAGGAGEGRGARDLKAAINTFKAQFIQSALEERNWNQTATARALDIQRTYLSRLIKELGIAVPKERGCSKLAVLG